MALLASQHSQRRNRFKEKNTPRTRGEVLPISGRQNFSNKNVMRKKNFNSRSGIRFLINPLTPFKGRTKSRVPTG